MRTPVGICWDGKLYISSDFKYTNSTLEYRMYYAEWDRSVDTGFRWRKIWLQTIIGIIKNNNSKYSVFKYNTRIIGKRASGTTELYNSQEEAIMRGIERSLEF